MDDNYQKRQIKKQNKDWAIRKEKKSNMKKDHHPWYYTCHLVKSRIENVSNYDIYKDDIHRD